MQQSGWRDYELSFIRKRYDRICKFYRLFEWILWLPGGIRGRAVEQLKLRPGDCVLEIGCGTGRNLSYLRNAVGESGRVYGVDLSPGMLAKAESLCQEQGWANVELSNNDFLDYTPRQTVDGVLFCLSYSTMPRHKQILNRAWSFLRTRRHVVIVDAQLPKGLLGKLLMRPALWLMRQTVLGNPYVQPWEDLRELTNDVSTEKELFGYYICRGTRAD